MKLLKILTMVLFSVLLSISVSFTQENNSSETGISTVDSGSAAVTKTETTDIEKSDSALDPPVSDTVIKKKSTPPVNETRKTVDKKSPDKKVTSNPPDTEVENISPVKLEGDLLPINDGNFIYKRIPDIKLVEITPETVVSIPSTEEVAGSVKNPDSGFLGLSKTVSDVVVKGGVLLLILVIFVLYKSRMTGPGNKSSKRRNVLNSYRK